MKRVLGIGFSATAVIFLLLPGFVRAETLELVTYYPSSAGGGGTHVVSITVGSGYQATPAGDGVMLVEGRLGIGTPSPSALLEMAGDANAGAGVPAQLLIRGATNGNRRLYLGYDTTANYGSLQAGEAGVGSTPLALQKLGGNVGIGVASPSVRLEVAQNEAIRLGNAFLSSGGPQFAHLASNAWSSPAWQIPDNTRRTGLLQFIEDAFYFYQTQTAGGTDWATRLSVLRGGNVGIGTATPTALLDVSGDGGSILVPRTDPVTRAAAWNPAGVDGMIYYNSAAGKLRGYESGQWKDFGPAAPTSLVSASGGYYGNGATQSFSVGFSPRAVLIFSKPAGFVIPSSGIDIYKFSTMSGYRCLYSSPVSYFTWGNLVQMTATGFQVTGVASTSGLLFYYIAFS